MRTYGSATELTGSTATVILIKHGDLICANLGDSRAVASLMGLVKNLSTDHNTSNAQERERVFSMGGTIKDNRYVISVCPKIQIRIFIYEYGFCPIVLRVDLAVNITY